MQASSPMVSTWKLANKVVRDMKGIDVKLLYKKLKGSKWLISMFTDASLGNLPDGVSSAYGIIILMSNGYEPRAHGDCCVLSWKSAKVKRVVSSTYDSEVLALSEGLEEAVVMSKA